MFQTKIVYFETIRHVLNVQLEFQHSSDTFDIFRHAFKCIFKVSENCLNCCIINLRHIFKVSQNSELINCCIINFQGTTKL